jgi:hypothetical protein
MHLTRRLSSHADGPTAASCPMRPAHRGASCRSPAGLRT